MRLFIALLLLASVGRADLMPSPKVKPDKIPLALNWKPEPQFGGFYAAANNGSAQRNHVAIEIAPGGAGTPVVQMVAAGKFNFGIASADEVILARARGADVVAVFAAYQTNPQAIMTHEERGFKSLADVYASKGTLAIQKGLPYALYLEKKYAGKHSAAIVPYLGGIQNFLADQNYSQQCFATSEPLAAEKKNAKVKTFLVADEGFNPYTTVLIVRGDFLKANKDLVGRVVDTVRAGWRSYLSFPDVTNKTMHELNKSMDLETFEASAKAQKPLIETANLGSMTEERWKTLRQQLVDLKLVKAEVLKTDINSYFRNLKP
jgi:NitT/TauT family transport system substrate-binding protein